MRYRRPGESTWSDGTTVNISRSGVLVAGAERFAAGDAIEMWMVHSAARTGVADVHASGRVERTETSAADGPRLAATIDSYWFRGEGRLPSTGSRPDEDI